MSILDKLIEKKDLTAYIDFRVKQIFKELKSIERIPENDRQRVVVSIGARATELKRLKGIVHEGQLKEESKRLGKRERR